MSKKIILKINKAQQIIDVQDILYIKAENVYSEFVFTTGAKVLITKTIRQFEEELKQHAFFRVHRSYLVNLHHVKSIQTLETNKLLLSDQTEIAVSRYRVKELLIALLK